MHFEEVQGMMGVVWSTARNSDDGSFIMQGVVGSSRGLPFFKTAGYQFASKLPISVSSNIEKKNQNDEYDTNVLIVCFGKSPYGLPNHQGIVQLLRDTADWLHSHTYSKVNQLQRQENRTSYVVNPNMCIETKTPMRKLDAVVLLAEAISIVKNKFGYLIGTPQMNSIIKTYFTEPISSEVTNSFTHAGCYHMPQHNIVN